MTLCHHTPREGLAELLYTEVWIAEHFYLYFGAEQDLSYHLVPPLILQKNKLRGKVFTKSQAVLQSGG